MKGNLNLSFWYPVSSYRLPVFFICSVLHESDIADVAHNIYKSIEKDRGMSKDMKSLLDIYIQARDMEAKNRDHYFKLAEVSGGFHGA